MCKRKGKKYWTKKRSQMQQICWRFGILQHTEKMKELTGDPKEAIRLTNGLFTAMFGGNKQQSENNSLLFYWDGREG